MRYLFQISYKGTQYHGWQSQKNSTGVQAIVENAMSTVLREKIDVVASGRTDTGVHCVKQFFHADVNRSFEKEKFYRSERKNRAE